MEEHNPQPLASLRGLVADDGTAPTNTLTLPYALRQRTRQRVIIDNGEVASLRLPRGTVLRPGQRLSTGDGRVVEVRAAAEEISIACTQDPLALSRACYHLGNRHVLLQISLDSVSYLRDSVLDQMVQGLGLSVRHASAPFEPEAGAYQGHHLHGEERGKESG